MKLFLASSAQELSTREMVRKALVEKGYDATLLEGSPKPEDGIVIVILTVDTTEEGLFSSLPWLKEQFSRSSYRGFRLMPFFVYDSKVIDPEEAFEGNVGEVYENVFSGEFKPFGYDTSDKNAFEEFDRILDEYSE